MVHKEQSHDTSTDFTKWLLETRICLASVHGVARQHNGEVRIQSERSLGTEVSIELPLQKE